MTWHDFAACKGVDISLFFPTTHSERQTQNGARKICYSCPVLNACLQAAFEEEQHLKRDEIHGFRGGLTANQRRELYKKRRKAA